MSKAAAQFPFKLFLHKICISFTTHTFLKWNHVKNCPLCEVCVKLSKVRILLFEAKQKVIPSDSSRQMGPQPRPYTYFQQIYNLSILGNPGCSWKSPCWWVIGWWRRWEVRATSSFWVASLAVVMALKASRAQQIRAWNMLGKHHRPSQGWPVLHKAGVSSLYWVQ